MPSHLAVNWLGQQSPQYYFDSRQAAPKVDVSNLILTVSLKFTKKENPTSNVFSRTANGGIGRGV